MLGSRKWISASVNGIGRRPFESYGCSHRRGPRYRVEHAMVDQSSPTGLAYSTPARPADGHARHRPAHQTAAAEPIGALIRRRRRALGLSQLQLAERLCQRSEASCIGQARISDYERGRHIPRHWLLPISAVLEIRWDELETAVLRAHLLKRRDNIRRAAPFVSITQK
ncbi:helix-turn-helix domain-containing protein [Haloechinothrix salitolerans]|uniref:Helix-turn-helix domain-containing protein n=1 Tax=Haloechinothrix salitolerans TaxID=926830 RepID=A0ABW2BWQ8_9PSEU